MDQTSEDKTKGIEEAVAPSTNQKIEATPSEESQTAKTEEPKTTEKISETKPEEEKQTEKVFEISLSGNNIKKAIQPIMRNGALFYVLLAVTFILLIFTGTSYPSYVFIGITAVVATIAAFFQRNKLPFYVLLILVVVIGLIIRTASLPALGATPLIGNDYLGMGGSLNGLDPYTFYGSMLDILSTGNIPAVNHMQYLPIGYITRKDNMLISFFGAFMYRFLNPIIPAATPMTWFMIYPPIVTIFTTILIFLIVLYIFRNYWTATLSAAIFPAFETFLGRSTAGFSTKTAMGFMFIMLSFFLLLKIVYSDKNKTKIFYGFLLAIAVGMAAASSGYVQYPELIIPAFFLTLIAFGYADRGDLYAYLPFALFIPIQASMMIVTKSNLESLVLFPMYITYVTVLFKLFVYDRYKSRFHWLKIPKVNEGMSVIIYSIVVMILLLAIVSPYRLLSTFGDISNEFAHPLGVGVINPVSQTIAEYGTMTLPERFSEYNFMTSSGIPINFLLLYIGSVILLYLISRLFKHWYAIFLLMVPFLILINGGAFTPSIGSTIWFTLALLIPVVVLIYEFILFASKKDKKLITDVLILAVVSLILTSIFTQLNQQSSVFGQTFLAVMNISSTSLYKYAAVAIVVILLLALMFDNVETKEKKLVGELFLFIFFLLTMVVSNVELRLLQPTDFVAVILIPFAIVFLTMEGTELIKKLSYFKYSQTEIKVISIAIILLAVAFVIIDLYSSLSISYYIAQTSGSGLALWGPTMLWIKDNTPTNSSIISWWDYGYWEENIANRTAVADGSNAYGYQSMIAKYFFEATSPYQYATYLHFIHQPTYAVISGSEVLKFSAISTIALEPTAFSPMTQTTSQANTNNIGNKSYQYVAVFGGSSNNFGEVNAPMYVNGRLWPASDNILYEVLIPFNYSSNIGPTAIGNPYGIVYNVQLQTASPILPIDNYCIYDKGCINVSSSGIPGGVMLLNATGLQLLHIGGYNNSKGYVVSPINLSQSISPISVLFMPNDTLNTLFTKLYLLNESIPGFKLVFTDNLPVNSYLSIENQVLTNINVYEINYTQLQKYELTGECSLNKSAINYCDNLNYLPSVFSKNASLISKTPILP